MTIHTSPPPPTRPTLTEQRQGLEDPEMLAKCLEGAAQHIRNGQMHPELKARFADFMALTIDENL